MRSLFTLLREYFTGEGVPPDDVALNEMGVSGPSTLVGGSIPDRRNPSPPDSRPSGPQQGIQAADRGQPSDSRAKAGGSGEPRPPDQLDDHWKKGMVLTAQLRKMLARLPHPLNKQFHVFLEPLHALMVKLHDISWNRRARVWIDGPQ